MRIATRLSLLSLAGVSVMTIAVVIATLSLLQGAQRQSSERLMQLELQNAELAIRGKLYRSGVVAAREEARAQWLELRAKPGFASVDLFVIQPEGRRIVFEAGDGTVLLASDPALARMQRGQAGSLWFDAAGSQRLAVFATVEPIHWLVGLSLSRSEIDAPLFTFLQAIGGITFAALCINALLFGFLGRGLIRRLARVLDFVERIDHGELDARLAESGSDDEIGMLKRSVNAMAERLALRTREQAESQAALAASEARLRRLVDYSIVGVFFSKMSGPITEANEAFLDMVGYTRADLDAGLLDWKKLTPPEHGQATLEASAELSRAGRVRPYEKSYRRKDGSLAPVLVGSVFLSDSRREGASFVVDLTERRQAEADRNARLVAENASRAKSAFLASMSHEIRTPMNAIIGMTYLLLREVRDPTQRDRLAKVNAAAEHLLQIINDILDLSRIEAGKMALEAIEFPLAATLAGSLQMVEEAAAAKGLELSMDIATLPAQVRGDPTRLSQVLLNLLSNAVKFTTHGSIRLGARVLSEPPGHWILHFEVRDTGEGVPAERQDRIFEAFEQADNSTTRRHGGTGLGLALSRHLAVMMGGEMGVNSEPGRGSTFWFTVRLEVADEPLAAQAAAAPPPAPVPHADLEEEMRRHHAGQRVLLAEDNPVNQELTRRMLEVAGLVVDVAENGARAVELATGTDYDLVLMDVQMPIFDGLQATRLIRLRTRPDLPIIAMTASVVDDDLVDCLNAGMNDTLPKPVGAAVFYAMLRRWLPERVARPAAAGPAA